MTGRHLILSGNTKLAEPLHIEKGNTCTQPKMADVFDSDPLDFNMSQDKEPLLGGGLPAAEESSPCSVTPTTQTTLELNDVHGQVTYGAQQMENPPNTYMIPAVLTCLFCLWPLGLAAIVNASQARDAIRAGNRQQAEASSAMARKLTKAALMCGMYIIGGALLFFSFILVLSNDDLSTPHIPHSSSFEEFKPIEFFP
ncbi:trafficking regulator of GLUT4 1-like [Ptychodera flava]|uniref:trafficking regulator of GLUT4 1-like n=1 Tax=Ptychodera flava TaxID=63121 RepID=UPI00396AAE30